jgi:predicted dehydrogenase
MPGKRLRVVIVGAGMIGNAAHIPAWKNLCQDADVVGVADISEERACQTAERYGIPHAYGDWNEMLTKLSPDIVSVCTPNVYHKAVTRAALKGGAHVLCEKPVATSYADAVEMYDTAQAAGRTLMVAQTVRFSGTMMAAKEIAAAGRLGEMYYAETSALRRRGIPKWGMFHMREHNAGGPVYDLGVHMIDALFWIMGNPKAVAVSGMTYCKLGNRDEGLAESLAESGAPLGVFTPRPYDYHEFNVEDFASGYIRLESGATVSLKTSWAANVPDGIGGTFIVGTEGGLQLAPLKLITNMGRYQVDIAPKVLADRNVAFAGHWEITAHMLRVLRGEEEMIVKREEVLNVIRALEGLYRSGTEGREVRLDL